MKGQYVISKKLIFQFFFVFYSLVLFKNMLHSLYFSSNSLDFGTFRDIFWRAKKSKQVAVSCPDVMFNIASPTDDDDAKYLNFASRYELKKIVETDGRVRWYVCIATRRYEP